MIDTGTYDRSAYERVRRRRSRLLRPALEVLPGTLRLLERAGARAARRASSSSSSPVACSTRACSASPARSTSFRKIRTPPEPGDRRSASRPPARRAPAAAPPRTSRAVRRGGRRLRGDAEYSIAVVEARDAPPDAGGQRPRRLSSLADAADAGGGPGPVPRALPGRLLPRPRHGRAERRSGGGAGALPGGRRRDRRHGRARRRPAGHPGPGRRRGRPAHARPRLISRGRAVRRRAAQRRRRPAAPSPAKYASRRICTRARSSGSPRARALERSRSPAGPAVSRSATRSASRGGPVSGARRRTADPAAGGVRAGAAPHLWRHPDARPRRWRTAAIVAAAGQAGAAGAPRAPRSQPHRRPVRRDRGGSGRHRVQRADDRRRAAHPRRRRDRRREGRGRAARRWRLAPDARGPPAAGSTAPWRRSDGGRRRRSVSADTRAKFICIWASVER